MKKLLRQVLTGTNFNSEDIIRGAVTIQVALLPLILIWGLTLETLNAFQVFKGSFDLQSFFASVLYYEGGVCTLIATGSAHMFFKKQTNADGSTTVEDDINKDPQRSITVDQANTTVINP
jgi:hypothetical protein